MQAHRRCKSWLSLAALVVGVAIVASPAPAKDTRAKAAADCDQPCKSVAECPKVDCQCDGGIATDVGACDTKAHCCASAADACESFCAAKKQKWTGKFGADTSGDASPASDDDKAAASAKACDHTCKNPEDCPKITCKCTKGTAPNVAACDRKAGCCGDARVVCGHYCAEQQDTWTGELAPNPQASDDAATDSALDEGDFGLDYNLGDDGR